MVWMPTMSGSTLASSGGIPVFGHSQRLPPLKMQRLSGAGGLTVTRRINNKKRKWGIRKTFKAKVKQLNPAKHLSGNTGVTINNAVIYTMNLTAQIGQGTGNNNRLGDAVFLEALKFEGFFQSGTAPNAYRFRLIIGWSGEEYGTTTLASGSLTSSELFLPSTDTTVTNAIINPKAFTAVYDEVHDLNSQVDGYRTIQSTRFTVPFKQSFPYQAATSVYGKMKNLYAVVVAYAADVAANTAIGSAVLSYDLIFKD